jgi:hypothetical protein
VPIARPAACGIAPEGRPLAIRNGEHAVATGNLVLRSSVWAAEVADHGCELVAVGALERLGVRGESRCLGHPPSRYPVARPSGHDPERPSSRKLRQDGADDAHGSFVPHTYELASIEVVGEGIRAARG